MAGPETAITQQCRFCKTIFPHTVEHFPSIGGKPNGTACRTCVRTRKRAYEDKYKRERIAVRAAAAAAAATLPASGVGAGENSVVQLPDLPSRKLEVSHALRSGAKALNDAAPEILATIIGYARNPRHPHHEWALKLIAERVIPKKLYEDLGAQAAGIKSGQGTVRPAVTIVVQQAAPVPPDQSRVTAVVDVTPTDVERDV